MALSKATNHRARLIGSADDAQCDPAEDAALRQHIRDVARQVIAENKVALDILAAHDRNEDEHKASNDKE